VKKSLGRPMHRWEVNVRMNLREIGWEGELDASGSG